jgi:Arc/MetJ family transcription regulator
VSWTYIDVDDSLLARAAEVLGTSTARDTVHSALAEVVGAEARRRHIDHLAGGGLPDLSDPGVMRGAWR